MKKLLLLLLALIASTSFAYTTYELESHVGRELTTPELGLTNCLHTSRARLSFLEGFGYDETDLMTMEQKQDRAKELMPEEEE